ncbi:MAG: L,D-transpeptidase family protein [Rhodobacteraceae bacterium]|nr:L,D-transpeptidase family protein [Paracoccaceae bacterium]MCP5342750.1 L,D-transpeptidase family protein [Paracoccaceae bacterium]
MSPHDLVLTPTGLRYHGRIFPVVLGRNRVTTNKREGDLATPSGTHHVIGLLYRPDRVAATSVPPWAVPIHLQDRWCDTPGDPAYNHLTRQSIGPATERLRRADPLYDLVLPLDWNWPEAAPGKGSAIFIHQWRCPGYPTAGCLGLSRRDLLFVARHARPGTQVMIRP